MKIGQTVYTNQHGEGVVLEINGTRAKVDFKGQIKEMLTFVLKTKAPKVKKVKKSFTPKHTDTFNTVVNGIVGDRTQRGSMFAFADVYTKIERMAFNEENGESHLAGKIIENARNGKTITNKQACVVAFFAKENGLLN